jgi:type IV pilus assembly protein PilA
MKKNTKGFSLIELLIVVAIILIIAAIAVPNLLRSRIAANQASAAQSLRTVNTSEVAYASTYPQGYSDTLVELAPPSSGNATSAAAGLIDSVLAAGVKSGYSFVYTVGGSVVNGSGVTTYNTYTFTATPSTIGTTGTNGYFTDQTMVIRSNASGTSTVADPPIGG